MRKHASDITLLIHPFTYTHIALIIGLERRFEIYADVVGKDELNQADLVHVERTVYTS